MAKKETTKEMAVPAPTTAALAKAKPQSGLATVKAMFEKQSDQLGRALAGQIDTDRFVRTALTAYSSGSAYFQSAHPVTLLGACMQAAELGLSVSPSLGEFWLIPRRDNRKGIIAINGQIGYKGLVKLARRNSNFLSVHAEIVSKGDFFEYDLGSEPRVTHRKQVDQKERPEVRCAYAVVRYREGPAQIHVSTLYEIEEARGRSEAFQRGQGPWLSHPISMMRVVPLRAILKLEAIDDAILRQLGHEDAQEASDSYIEVGIDGEVTESLSEIASLPVADPKSIDELKTKFGASENPEAPGEPE